MPSGDPWIPLAEVMRPHGVRGEVRLRLFNPDSDVLLSMEEVLVRLKEGGEHEVSVDTARRANDAILMKLYSVDDRDRADELRGALICGKRSQLPTTEDGEFYAVDVVDAEVVLEGKVIGLVTEYRSYPSVDIFVVKMGEKELEVPSVDAYVESVDVPNKRIVLRTIEGLLE